MAVFFPLNVSVPVIFLRYQAELREYRLNTAKCVDYASNHFKFKLESAEPNLYYVRSIDREVHLRFLNWLSKCLTVMGIPGLLAISFLDSAAVPLVGGPDALILVLASIRPKMVCLIVLAATVGSMLGCLVLYGIGWKGGAKALSRFGPEKVARIERRMQDYGIWAIIVSVLAPPPFPTKLVILAAGVLRIGKIRLAVGTFIGRLLRYSLMGYLAVRFGNQAAQVLKNDSPALFVILIVGILLIVVIRNLRKRSAESSLR
jgi:membrane protein YqaA with SNARE-associated domain